MSSVNYVIYSFHMPLMFMTAGYSHAMKDHTSSSSQLSGYLKKYVVELYLPAVYFSLIFWSLKYFFISPANNPEDLTLTTLEDLYLIPISGYNQYWFIFALFPVKVLHVFLERLFKDKGCVNSLFWLAFFVMLKASHSYLPDAVSNLSHGFYFHVGYLLKRKELITDSNHPRLVYGLLLAVIGTVLLSVRGSNIGAALCISLALFIVFYDLRIDNRFLVSCGLSSMVIFVTHQYTRNLMRIVYIVI